MSAYIPHATAVGADAIIPELKRKTRKLASWGQGTFQGEGDIHMKVLSMIGLPFGEEIG